MIEHQMEKLYESIRELERKIALEQEAKERKRCREIKELREWLDSIPPGPTPEEILEMSKKNKSQWIIGILKKVSNKCNELLKAEFILEKDVDHLICLIRECRMIVGDRTELFGVDE